MQTDPLEILQDNATALKSFGARRIGVFGSAASATAGPQSDIDIFVEFQEDMRTFRNFNALYDLLESLFHRPVDLVTDASLDERKARIILPTVRYASLAG
jgi:uncharacterized protein